ncbi:MAG TPA: hypothetical protein VGF99_21250 [Myxococcota bacterium]
MKLSRLLLCVPAIVCVSSCVIPIGGAEVGDLRVTWTFDSDGNGNGTASQRCAQVGVDNVTVQLIQADPDEGEPALAFGQTAECIAGSMVIPDVVAGKYTLTAVGEGDVAIYNNGAGVPVEVVGNQESSSSASLTLVNGDVVATIEFPYTFDGSPRCADAGVTTLIAEVIDENLVIAGNTEIQCGQGVATVTSIRVGQPTLHVRGVDGNGNVRFRTAPEGILLQTLQAGQVSRIDTVDLQPALVNATARYTFGGVSLCSQAGVTTVDAQLRTAGTNQVVSGQNVACVAGRIDFVDVPAGTYDLHLDALDGNNVVQFTKDVPGLEFNDARKDLGTIDLTALSSQVVVRFQLPEGETCATLGIANIDLQIVDGSGGRTGVAAVCVGGEATLAGPAPGIATITAQGVVGTDVIIDAELDVNLRPGRNIVNLQLEAQRSLLDLSWSFLLRSRPNVDNATVLELPSTSCRDADIDNVLVTVSRGTTLLDAQTVACDARRIEIPALPIGNSPVTVALEGLRLQEADSIFFIEREVTLVGARTTTTAVLEPSIPFARVVWNGDCGAAGAATVDIQVRANSVIEAGINVPCAQGTTVIALPAGTDESNVTILLRGVSGQGVPVGAAAEPVSADGALRVINGINTFRFAGPTG